MSDAPTQLRAIADELRKEHAEGYLCIFCFDGQIMAKCIADAADEIDRLRAENAALTAAVERVRALHTPKVEGDSCPSGCQGTDALVEVRVGEWEWPSCPTLRALEETP